MMSVYAVMCKDGSGHRWIDSLWIRKFAWENGAECRRDLLNRTFDGMTSDMNSGGLKAWILEMILQDGEVDPSQRTSGPEPGGTDAAKQKAGGS